MEHPEPSLEEKIEIPVEETEDECDSAKHVAGHFFYRRSVYHTTLLFCSACTESLLGKDAYCCEVCKISVHKKCRKDPQISCYEPVIVSTSNEIVYYTHFWSSGNTKAGNCLVCKKKVTTGKKSFSCSHCRGCKNQIHNECIAMMEPDVEKCSPKHGNLLLPNNLPFDDVASLPASFMPLLIFINAKSGGQQGLVVIRKLRGLLSPRQVISLLEETPVGPKNAIEEYGRIPNLRILVCGGDGTVGWVLQELLDARDDIIESDWIPPVSILPLGTGNDLARVLKWGGGYAGEKITSILKQIESASICLLDRWKVIITSKETQEEQSLILNNYFSVGLDAKISMQFHQSRESSPGLFKSRTVNKGFYGAFGIQKLIDSQPILKKFGLTLFHHDEPVDPSQYEKLKCLVWLNIPSYGGGASLWSNPSASSEFGKCLINDNLLELVGLRNIPHIMGIQAKIQHGLRVCQENEYTVSFTEKCYVQVDGEPLLLGPSDIIITSWRTARMLCKNTSK